MSRRDRKPLDINRVWKVKKRFDLLKWLDSVELGRHIRNRMHKNYGDYFIGRVPDKEVLIKYIEEYLSGEIDYTTDIKFESYEEFKMNRGLDDE